MGRRVRDGAVRDPQFAIGNGVGDLGVDRARIAFLAVRTFSVKDGLRSVARHLSIPYTLVEPLESSMKMIRRLVRRQVVLAAVDGKSRVRDAIRIAPDNRYHRWCRRCAQAGGATVDASPCPPTSPRRIIVFEDLSEQTVRRRDETMATACE